jgi:hypothetical protein
LLGGFPRQEINGGKKGILSEEMDYFGESPRFADSSSGTAVK